MPESAARLTAAQVRKAADILFEARTHAARIRGLPADVTPVSMADASRIRDELFRLLGGRCLGWFMGGTSRHSMVPMPYFAPILPAALYQSGAAFDHRSFFTFDVDLEIGFSFAKDVPAGTRIATAAEVLPFIDHVYPTLDVMNSQFEDPGSVGWPTIVANNGTDGVVIRGSPTPVGSIEDFATLKAVLAVNGSEVLSGSASVVMGSPLEAVRWFICEMARSQTIRKGSFLTTGSIVPVYRAQPGDVLTAAFTGLGAVTTRYL
ncbi:MAG: 2-keto-4-pentenoate hydratase [Parvibaculaceae bacterium]